MGFERARSTRSSPADASTATTERSEGVRRAARRGMPSGRGLSVGVYSSLPLFSSHLLNDVVSLTTTPLPSSLRHDLPLTLPLSLFPSPRASPPRQPYSTLRNPSNSHVHPHSRNIVFVSPPTYQRTPSCVFSLPACFVFSSCPFTTEIEPVDRLRRLLIRIVHCPTLGSISSSRTTDREELT